MKTMMIAGGVTREQLITDFPVVRYQSSAIGYHKLPKSLQLGDENIAVSSTEPPDDIKGQLAHKLGSLGGATLRNNTNCHEYLALDGMSDAKEELEQDLTGYQSKIDNQRAQIIADQIGYLPATYKFYDGLKMPSVLIWFAMIISRIVAALLWLFILPGTALLTLFTDGTAEALQVFKFLFTDVGHMIVYFPALLIFIPSWLLWKSGLPRLMDPKMPIHVALKRDTGMIRFIKGIDNYVDVPFSEFEARYTTQTDGANRIMARLYLAHKHSSKSFIYGAPYQERWYVGVAWEFLQHYMDVSRPLPDVPEFEPYRHLDPTTAEWDKLHKRPTRLWRDMDQSDYYKMCRSSEEAAINYPFNGKNSTDENAWQAAGDGKHWYQLG